MELFPALSFLLPRHCPPRAVPLHAAFWLFAGYGSGCVSHFPQVGKGGKHSVLPPDALLYGAMDLCDDGDTGVLVG